MWKAGAALLGVAGVAGASYAGWDLYQSSLLAFPRLPALHQRPKGPWVLYVHDFENESRHLNAVKELQGVDKYAVRLDALPKDIADRVDKEAGVYLYRTVDDFPRFNSFDSGDSAKMEAWLKLHLDGPTLLESVEALQQVLLNRNKSHFLDSVVVAFAPEASERLEQYEKVVEKVKYNDLITQSMLGYGHTHIKFFRITDPAVAAALNIDTEGPLRLYKYKDSRGWYDLKLPKTAYVSPHAFKLYLAAHLASHFKINGTLMQLQLGIYRDEFVYVPDTSLSIEGKHHSYPSLDDLATGIARVNPVICPLWSIKDLQMMSLKVASFLRKHSKVLIVSVNKDKDERDLSDLGLLMRQLKIDQVAKENADILVITGEPKYIAHLPIRDIAYSHFDPVEIRLLDVQDGRVVSTSTYNGDADMCDWVKKAEPSLQTTQERPPENAKNIDGEGLRVALEDDQCYFVMFCSTSCPACTYTAPHFQSAAGMPSPCKYVKYNVSNECPVYKAPGATPTFLLYKPGHKSDPVKFDVRERGLGAEKFQAFIEEQVGSSQVA